MGEQGNIDLAGRGQRAGGRDKAGGDRTGGGDRTEGEWWSRGGVDQGRRGVGDG